MRSGTLRWIILITTVASGLLVAAQLFWLNRVYRLEESQFRNSIIRSIKGVYEDLHLSTSSVAQLQQIIEQPDPNTYLFRIDRLPNREQFAATMLSNLQGFQVFTDGELAVYSAKERKLLYRDYLPAPASGAAYVTHVPVYNRPYNYAMVYFPHRSQYILHSMTWWIVSGAIVLIVLVALGLCIFYLYKQKFLNEIQNDFIQNVTHEFQTPLTTLSVGLDALEKPSVVSRPERLDTYLKLMRVQTEYLKQHIENLMKVLKAEASGMEMQKGEVVVNTLIRRSLVQLHNLIDEKHAVVDLQLEPGDQVIFADQSSLYMVIVNLLSNALKYAAEPRIVFRTKVSHNHYIIAIKDNGIGIAEEDKKSLFKKFYRVPSGDVHNVKGLGLGLYFVKKIIEGHNGTITVRSTAGQGAEFIIDLPIH